MTWVDNKNFKYERDQMKMEIRPHQIEYTLECIDKYINHHKKAKKEKYHALRDVFINELVAIKHCIKDIRIED